MSSTPSGSQATAPGRREDTKVYEPPVVLATFGKQDLAGDLPENLTPHIHSVQSS